MKSILNLRFTLGLVRGSARPHTLDVAKAVAVAEDLHARWESVASRCGHAWTAAQARRIDRELRSALAASKVGGGA